MKVAIVSGSHRVESQSRKVAQFSRTLLQRELGIQETFLLDLGVTPPPEWDEGKWQNTELWQTAWEPISQQLQDCDALVVVSPEWGGMVPARLKNFFLLCDRQELAHKPGLIVGVSAGRGGSYPVAELRMSSYKNTRLLWIPEHVIVQNVEAVLNDPFTAASEADRYIRDRLLYGLNLLKLYGECLVSVRTSDVIDHEAFPYGM